VHAGAEIECLDLPELGEVVQRLVDGLERDRRHFGARRLVDDLGRGMRHVPLEDPEDALALRGDLAPTLAEQLAQLFGVRMPTLYCQRLLIDKDCCEDVRGPRESHAACGRLAA